MVSLNPWKNKCNYSCFQYIKYCILEQEHTVHLSLSLITLTHNTQMHTFLVQIMMMRMMTQDTGMELELP